MELSLYLELWKESSWGTALIDGTDDGFQWEKAEPEERVRQSEESTS